MDSGAASQKFTGKEQLGFAGRAPLKAQGIVGYPKRAQRRVAPRGPSPLRARGFCLDTVAILLLVEHLDELFQSGEGGLVDLHGRGGAAAAHRGEEPLFDGEDILGFFRLEVEEEHAVGEAGEEEGGEREGKEGGLCSNRHWTQGH